MKMEKRLAFALFVLYGIALLYVTLFAWNYGASLGAEGPDGRNYNLIPLRSIYRISVFSGNWHDPFKILIGNIILFIPLGFLLPLLLARMRSIGKVVFAGFLVSLAIELTQFTFTQRVADIDDLLLNTLGTLLGAWLAFLMLALRRRVFLFLNEQK